MNDEFHKLINEGISFKKNVYNNNNNYIINSEWLQKWKHYYNLSIQNNNNNIYYNNNDIYYNWPGSIKNLEIMNHNSFTDDPHKKYIISKNFKYNTISEETWNLFKNHYKYDKEIKINELYYEHTNYIILRLNSIVYFYYYRNINIPTTTKILNDFIEYLRNFNNISLLKTIDNKNLEIKKIKDGYYEIIIMENNINIDKEKKVDKNKKLLQSNGLVGLQNLGATCFMNSTLQLFSNIPELKDYLYNKDYMSDLEKIQSKGNITKSLGFVIENLWSSNSYYSFAPSQFKSIIGYYNPKFLRNEPNDSRELIQYIIDSLHEELNINKGREYTEDEDDNMNLEKQFKYEKDSFEYENNSIISKLFYGIQGIETKCLKCNNKFYSFDHFSILSLPILETINRTIELTEMLKNFEEEIKMTGDNKFYCTECNKEREAITKTFLYDLPKYLIIHPAMNKIQVNDSFLKIFLTEYFDFSRFVYKNKISYYELIGVIAHLNSIGLPHNITFCKRGSLWYKFDDSYISKVSFNNIFGLPLILLYKKIK